MKKNTIRRGHSRKLAFPLLALIAALSLGSCKKDSGSGSPTSNASLLTSASWKQTAFEWQTTDGKWVAPPSWASIPTYPPTMTLFDNGTFTSSFNAGSSSNSYGTWQLSADKTQLIMLTQSGSSVTATMAALSGTTLQLTTALNPKDTYTIEGSGSTAKYTYYTTERTTFSH